MLFRSDHVHQSFSPAIGNKAMAASATASDGAQACSTAMGAAPALTSYVEVKVNGINYVVGNGVKTKDCYFSGDSGSTARAFGAIASGDYLYWNGSVAGFQLDTNDVIDFLYNA
mgnify:CR=1 FL=1